MIRKLVFFDEKTLDILESLDDKGVNEHIRRAVDEYIERRKNLKSAKSPSKNTNKEINQK